eukprot:scaffold319_cov244-Pinguiococcus_pyrenoidosus.AAC.8
MLLSSARVKANDTRLRCKPDVLHDAKASRMPSEVSAVQILKSTSSSEHGSKLALSEVKDRYRLWDTEIGSSSHRTRSPGLGTSPTWMLADRRS